MSDSNYQLWVEENYDECLYLFHSIQDTIRKSDVVLSDRVRMDSVSRFNEFTWYLYKIAY